MGALLVAMSGCVVIRTVPSTAAQPGRLIRLQSDTRIVLLLHDSADSIARECQVWELYGRVRERTERRLTLANVRVTDAPRSTPRTCLRGDSAHVVLTSDHRVGVRSVSVVLTVAVGLSAVVLVPLIWWPIRILSGR